MTDGVLPLRKLFFIVGESVPDEITNATESESLVGRLKDGHGYQGNVGVWRFDGTILLVNFWRLVFMIIMIFIMFTVNVSLITDFFTGILRMKPRG